MQPTRLSLTAALAAVVILSARPGIAPAADWLTTLIASEQRRHQKQRFYAAPRPIAGRAVSPASQRPAPTGRANASYQSRGGQRADPLIAPLVMREAARHRIDPTIIFAVIQHESAGNPNAVSPQNAAGLMQLIPATAERFGVIDRFDPAQNIAGGVAYLRWLLDYFDQNLALALAGYNAGEQAVERYGRSIPPYPETQRYVRQILAALPR